VSLATSTSTSTRTGRYVDACARRPVDRPPVWLMGQAGRYLTEHRILEARAGGFVGLLQADLCAEASLLPVRRFGLDAAIIFGDILVAVAAMGGEVAYDAPGGPRVRASVDTLVETDPRDTCGALHEALRIVRRELPGDAALLGFAGAPFTVACYVLDGRRDGRFESARARLITEPALRPGLERIVRFTAEHLAAQVEAGADGVVLFDPWADLLGPEDLDALAHDLARRTIAAFRERTPRQVPVAYHGPPSISIAADVYAIDWRQDLTAARHALPAVQGNLDPAVLLARDVRAVRARTRAMLARASPGSGYIASLGQGIHPDTAPAAVEAFVEEVRSWKP
jgi:uroporphyrinogen decarboxylase